jgi:hypothetical protein
MMHFHGLLGPLLVESIILDVETGSGIIRLHHHRHHHYHHHQQQQQQQQQKKLSLRGYALYQLKFSQTTTTTTTTTTNVCMRETLKRANFTSQSIPH